MDRSRSVVFATGIQLSLDYLNTKIVGSSLNQLEHETLIDDHGQFRMLNRNLCLSFSENCYHNE